ncbi:MAG: MFS transporter [Candidatus Bathyarchaeota archaeon]
MTEEKKSMRNVFALGLVSFFTDISSEMVFCILPAFILALPGSSPTLLGLIEGTAEALSYGMRAVSGAISDKFKKRKPLVLVGYGLSNIIKPLFAVAQTGSDALLIRVGDRVGKGIRTAPRDALISDSVPRERQGAAFGLHRTLDQTGAIVGPLIASATMLFLGFSVRDVFWLSFIPGAIALVILVFYVKEQVGKEKEYRFLQGVGGLLKGEFLRLLCVVSIFSLGAFNFSFILMNARDVGIQDALLPILYAGMNIAHVVIAIPIGVMGDRYGKEKALLAGYVAFMVATGFLYAAPASVAIAVITAVVFGFYEGIVNTATRALIPRFSDSDLRGTAYGLYYLAVGLSVLVANIMVGYLWQNYGRGTAALYSFSLSLAAIIGLLLLIRMPEEV